MLTKNDDRREIYKRQVTSASLIEGPAVSPLRSVNRNERTVLHAAPCPLWVVNAGRGLVVAGHEFSGDPATTTKRAV